MLWERGCFFKYMPVYSIIFSVIEAYSHMLRNFKAIFRLIQAYLAPFVILTYSQSCYIFWALAYLGPEAYLKHCETLTRYIQNPAVWHYSAIFRTLHKKKPGIFEILEYLQTLHSCIPTYTQNPVIFPVDIYLLKVNSRNTRTKVWNMFKVNNKATKTTAPRFGGFIVNFEHILHLCSSVSIVNFEHVIADQVNESLRIFITLKYWKPDAYSEPLSFLQI